MPLQGFSLPGLTLSYLCRCRGSPSRVSLAAGVLPLRSPSQLPALLQERAVSLAAGVLPLRSPSQLLGYLRCPPDCWNIMSLPPYCLHTDLSTRGGGARSFEVLCVYCFYQEQSPPPPPPIQNLRKSLQFRAPPPPPPPPPPPLYYSLTGLP